MSGETISNLVSTMDHSQFNHIKAFIFDVDGVFTNSEVLITESGELLRTMNTRDGQAVKYAIEAGYVVAVITKGASEGVRKRFEYLGLIDIYDKLKEKTVAFQQLMEKYDLSKDEMLYMGDDIPDLPLFDLVGLSSCPADAVNDVLAKATYVSPLKGGYGCVREVIERTMRTQGRWVI